MSGKAIWISKGVARMTTLVLVEWMDSRQPDSGWKHLSKDLSWKAVKCASVGWLVADDADKKVLAPNMGDIDDEDNIQLSGEIVIPTCCIVSVTQLTEIGPTPKKQSKK